MSSWPLLAPEELRNTRSPVAATLPGRLIVIGVYVHAPAVLEVTELTGPLAPFR